MGSVQCLSSAKDHVLPSLPFFVVCKCTKSQVSGVAIPKCLYLETCCQTHDQANLKLEASNAVLAGSCRGDAQSGWDQSFATHHSLAGCDAPSFSTTGFWIFVLFEYSCCLRVPPSEQMGRLRRGLGNTWPLHAFYLLNCSCRNRDSS